MEHGNETEQTGEKGKQAKLSPIGFDRVARSYYGGSGRKIGAFREYIRACYLNPAGKAGAKLGRNVG